LRVGSQFLIAPLSMLLTVCLAVAGAPNSEPKAEMRPGVAIFKVEAALFSDIGATKVERLGDPAIDAALERIGAIGVERKFPHNPGPARPGGTDLRPILNVYFPESVSVWEACRILLATPGVRYAHPWWIDEVYLPHNDSLRDQQYALNLIRANQAHDSSRGSPAVVIGIVDLGGNLTHPDLAANIWQNLGEDANGDGQLTNEDIDTTDNDQNGHVDDFYGWDFQGNDRDPTDINGHGVHVSGIASAVTNNEEGVASIGYSCALMSVRTGQGTQINFGYEGIEYAYRNEAHIINCSWGGTQRTDAAQEVITAAFEAGTLVVAACGNSGNARVLYPAGYDHVLSVAATDRNDVKTNFSTYGDWVDISAPGVEIITTTLGTDYNPSFLGTSAASPHVAGAAGLLKARFPNAPPDILTDFLVTSADNIDQQNPNFVGMLGGGRLNAYAALRAAADPVPLIQSINLIYEDNGNNVIEPGEMAGFTVTVVNRGTPPEELIATFSSDDPAVEVIHGEVTFPNLDVGQRHTNTDEPFIIEVALDFIPHTAVCTVTLHAQPGDLTRSRDYEFLLGHPNILIVDDDGGLDYEQYHKNTVTAIRQGWLNWDCSRVGPPPDTVLSDHSLVIWETGDAYPPLDEYDRISIRTGLARGARMLLSGRYIGDDPENRQFIRTYLGATHGADSVGASVVLGVSRRAAVRGDEVLFLTGEGGSDDGNISPSTMTVLTPGDSLFVYSQFGEIMGLAGVYKHDQRTNAKTIYLGFNFAAISNIGTRRETVLESMLRWFAPELSADWPEPPLPGNYLLELAFPNPFNGLVRLDYSLAREADFRLAIFDQAGREVTLVESGQGRSGRHSTFWRPGELPSGVYFARLDVPGEASSTQKLVLMK